MLWYDLCVLIQEEWDDIIQMLIDYFDVDEVDVEPLKNQWKVFGKYVYNLMMTLLSA